MDLLLRYIDGSYIEDCDLSSQNRDFDFQVLHLSFDSGKWKFISDVPVTLNGNSINTGYINVGDTYIISRSQHRAIVVLEAYPDDPVSFVPKDHISIGRAKDNDIVINNSKVSSHHCVIYYDDKLWCVKDLGSTNGTIVNNHIIDRKTIIEDSIITVGTVKFSIGETLDILNYNKSIEVSLKKYGASDNNLNELYPMFTRSPRMITDPGILTVNIESAPSIGDKPSIGVGGIPLSLSMIAVSLGMQALRYSFGKKKYTKLQKQRAEIYANYLAVQESKIIEHINKQKEYCYRIYPTASKCLSYADINCKELWERHPDDPDFLAINLGVGTVDSQTVITIPEKRLQMKSDEMDDVPGQIAEKYKTVNDMPITFNLKSGENCGIIGNKQSTAAVAANFMVQLAALHSYDEVKLVVLFPENDVKNWEWVRFLPHCNSLTNDLRYVACSRTQAKPLMEEIEAILKMRTSDNAKWNFGRNSRMLPYFVFVVADLDLLYDSKIGEMLLSGNPDYMISGLFLGNTLYELPHNINHAVSVSAFGSVLGGTLKDDAGEVSFSRMEIFSEKDCDTFARNMAPIRLKKFSSDESKSLPTSVTFFEGIGIDSVDNLNMDRRWNMARSEESLAVPIGVKASGEPFVFDIHQKHHGPHGLVAGGTGSGKSQMAQTWILSMALNFSPDDINFILVDFKGESLLQPFEKLPHIAGMISNLDKDVSRSFVALESELVSRQKRLAENGCTDIIEYKKLARTKPDMAKMPYLILVIDEYAELKQQFPDFSKSLDHLFRGGRSLGMLVLLMTQQPSGVITDQMRANANFSWCLSVRDESDSRAILGVPDAALIRNPGRAYVKSGDGTFELIQSYYCGAPYKSDKNTEAEAPVVKWVKLNGERVAFSDNNNNTEKNTETEISLIVDYIHKYCETKGLLANKLWNAELESSIDLVSVLKTNNDYFAKNLKNKPTKGPIALIGIADDPQNQKYINVTHDFEDGGNLAVYGMPLSGKTTFLKTIIESLCFLYSPETIQFYFIECGGFGLKALQSLPHVGAAASDDDIDTVKRILGFLIDELDYRKKLFKKQSVSTFASYRSNGEKIIAQIVLAVDNLNQLIQTHDNILPLISKIAMQGSAYGINIICSFAGVSNINYQLIQNFKTLYALQLPEKSDYYSIVGRPEVKIPDGIAGRGLMRGENAPLLFQTYFMKPTLSEPEREKYLINIANKMAEKYKGVLPKAIKSLPEKLVYGDIEMPADKIVLGLDLENVMPVELPRNSTTSILISASGKKILDSFVECLIKQAISCEESKCYIYLGSNTFLKYADTDSVITGTYADLDNCIGSIADELRTRQSVLKKEKNAVFPFITIILPEYAECIKTISQETAARLEVIIRLGKGLNVSIIAADVVDRLNSCIYSSNILTATIKQNTKIIIGGKIIEHQITDSNSIPNAYSTTMESDEACYLLEKGHMFLKLMLVE